MSDVVLGLEARVFGALDKKRIKAFAPGFYFRGDRNWSRLPAFVKRPDIIYCEPYGNDVIVRPYDIKASHNIDLYQSSALALVHLYRNFDFKHTLHAALARHEIPHARLHFAEGGFVIPDRGVPLHRRESDGYGITMQGMPFENIDSHVQKIRKLTSLNNGNYHFGPCGKNHGLTRTLYDFSECNVPTGVPYRLDTSAAQEVNYHVLDDCVIRVCYADIIEVLTFLLPIPDGYQ